MEELEANGEEEVYVVRIPKDEIGSLKADPKFLLVLRLMRYQNQLEFCFQAFLDHIESKMPVGLRQKANALMFMCGVLYEAMRIIPELGKEFRDFECWEGNFGTFFKSADVVFLRTRVLNKMRNNIVFHVDNDVIQRIVDQLRLSSYELIADTSGVNSTCYPLADSLGFNLLVEGDGPDLDEEFTFFDLTEKIFGVMRRFLHYSELLVDEYAAQKGWFMVEDSAYYRNYGEMPEFGSDLTS